MVILSVPRSTAGEIAAAGAANEVKAPAAGGSVSTALAQRRRSLDFNWRFFHGDARGADSAGFDDSKWRKLDVPHDWSIEGPFSEKAPSGTAGGYAPLGIGWYRKAFLLPADCAGKQVMVQFDGVFARAVVWLNGRKVGENNSGYHGFACDITPYLKAAGTNVLAVRADNSKQKSRWYTGSGIYRHVWLIATDQLHIDDNGVSITTPVVEDAAAKVRLKTTVSNESKAEKVFDVLTKIMAPDGRVVGASEVSAKIHARAKSELVQDVEVAQPRFWSTETPHLYKAITEIHEGGSMVDVCETAFGIRTIKFDANRGFLLNGRKVVLKGVCIHHELGALGAAFSERAAERRLEILKGMGCNALRLSHNPHAPELLDLCDRMGILVIDECFDGWGGFRLSGKGWRDNLGSFLARDRNHPSVILWSVGNEVMQQSSREGASLLKSMVDFVHQAEPTRPVTCALRPGPTEPEMRRAMDVVSMNYQTMAYDKLHANNSGMIILGSETMPFYTMNLNRKGASDKYFEGNPWFAMKDYVCGQFIWAGIDYLGEAGKWPLRGWPVGLVDTCGFRKDFSYFQQSLQATDPVVRIVVFDPAGGDIEGKRGWGWPKMASHWNWPLVGLKLKVVVFTNCDSVDLMLNGKPLGEKKLSEFPDRMISWEVPYEPGNIRAVAKKDGNLVCSHEIKTAGPAAKIELVPDRGAILADGRDLSHVEVRVVDRAGTRVPEARNLIRFEISGPGVVVGVDNGDLTSMESYKASQREAREGRCLAIIGATKTAGEIRLIARSAGLTEKTVVIRSSGAPVSSSIDEQP